ncbi:hypothetical protein [uncultured Tateyamaria sp.]|nr:hypothetical protein [uncultured Tateyamaria sp.]
MEEPQDEEDKEAVIAVCCLRMDARDVERPDARHEGGGGGCRMSELSLSCEFLRCAQKSPFEVKVNRVGDMELNWKRLSNKQKTVRTAIIGSLAIVACLIWYDDILQWNRGRGPLFLAICFVGFPLQALYYGFKWHKELEE